MDAGGSELVETQAELQAVKRALRDGAVHLGMKGDTLQRYLLQLSEKENLLLSRQLHSAPAAGQAAAARPAFLAHASGPGGAHAAAANGHHMRGTNGSAAQAMPARPEPRKPPPGPPQAFDRNNLAAVLSHMCDYEAVPLESTRALRALASLAYADAAFNMEDSRVLPQILRLLAIHHGEPQVQLAAMRVLCNVAYDPDTALKRLTDPGILRAILQAMEGNPSAKELAPKASEAAARIVAAETCPMGQAVSDGGPVRSASPAAVEDVGQGLGALAGFFGAALTGDSACQRAAVALGIQLLSNEVVLPAVVAERFATSAQAVPSSVDGATAAWGWLSLSKQLATAEGAPGLADCLVEAGCIRVAAGLMEQHAGDWATQLVGVEAMSNLIGNRFSGLQAFAEVQGVKRIEAALRAHGSDSVLQTKGVRALSCGIAWPADLQRKSGYAYATGVELTKAAMSQHGDCAELQMAALEALSKYLDKLSCVEEVKASGGEGLVKAMMTRHAHVQKVQTWGKVVLDAIGGDPKWQPRMAATA